MDENGKKHGEVKALNSKGRIVKICHYKHGKKDGSYIRKHPNGSMFIVCNYKNGKLDGEYKRFYNNENLELHCFFINGKIEGTLTQYYRHKNLDVKSKHLYKDGVPVSRLADIGWYFHQLQRSLRDEAYYLIFSSERNQRDKLDDFWSDADCWWN